MASQRPLSGPSAGHQRLIRGHQRHSETTQWHSVALRGHSAAPQRAPGPETATRTQIASAIIGGATAARAPVCCAIVVRTSPSLSPLTTLAPPPSFSACPRRSLARRRPTAPTGTMATPRSRPSSRAARCARFACSQRYSEVIRGHSEGTQRPSGALSGHPRALRGQSAARREAIRGDQRALRGTHRPSEGTQRPSLAIIRNQQHSVALSGNQEGAGTQDGHDGHIAC